MDVRPVALTANQRTRITRPGRFFMLLEAGGPLDITFERNKSPTGEIARNIEAGYQRFPGDWADRDEGKFESVILESTTAQNVVIGISQTAADYKRTVGIIQIQQPNDIDTTADVSVGTTVTTILAANSSRKKVILRALKANSGTIRVGETGIIAASRGMYLDAGESLTLDTTAEIRGIATAAAQLIAVLEETRT